MFIPAVLLCSVLVTSIQSFSDIYFGPGNRFYTPSLTTHSHCRGFLSSWEHKLARCHLYIHPAGLFLDPEFEFPLTACLNYTDSSQERKILLTEFRAMNTINPEGFGRYKEIQATHAKTVLLVPLLNVILGPGGSRKNLIRQSEGKLIRNMLIVLAPTEKENVTVKYGDDFTRNLTQKLLPFAQKQENTRMIQLNAWHLVNMQKLFDWDGLKQFMGIILYARPETGSKLSKHEIWSRIPVVFQDRIYLDVLNPFTEYNSAGNCLPFALHTAISCAMSLIAAVGLLRLPRSLFSVQ